MKYLNTLLFLTALLGCSSLFAQFNLAVHYTAYKSVLGQPDPFGNFVAGIPNPQQVTYKEHSYDYGTGNEYGTSLGYRFRQRYLIGLDLMLFSGKPSRRTGISSFDNYEEERRGESMRIGIHLQNFIPLNSKQNLSVYSRLGLQYTTNNELTTHTYYSTTFAVGMEEEQEALYSGGDGSAVALGLGIRYGETKDIFFQLGLKGVFQSYRPERRDLLRATVGDENVLPQMNTYSRVTEYRSEYSVNNFQSGGGNLSRKELPISFPFHGLGVEFSMGFEF